MVHVHAQTNVLKLSLLLFVLLICFYLFHPLSNSVSKSDNNFSGQVPKALFTENKVFPRIHPKIRQLSEKEIFDKSYPFQQDDYRLLNYIRRHHLVQANRKPYNLQNATEDSSKKEGQNKYILRILRNMKNGFFIESGAWDGERLSTTLRLERDFGWTGLLVEPNGASFQQLLAKNRKAWAINACLSLVNHPVLADFGAVVKDKGYGEVLNSLKTYLTANKNTTKMIKTPCFPIFSILAALNVTTVDFYRLDIEGAEMEVLKTIPFDQLFIKTFSIERNHAPEGKESLKAFVESKGYVLAKTIHQTTASDYIFAHKSIKIPKDLK